jgi:HTH-type transcriptional regulator/antitoxin HigA
MLHSNSVIAVPPGATIREQLENRGMSQREFAQRMGLSEKHISRLINGKVELTPDVALRLESVLGVPASFWNNLEAIYRERIARANAENELAEEKEIARKFPYVEMAKLGWVAATTNVEERVDNLRKFFEVARLGLLDDLKVPGIAYRTVGESEESNYILAAWAQKARLEARKVETHPIDVERLRSQVPRIRELTVETPDVFCPRLRSMLSECGVAIIFLPHISRSFLHGATFIDRKHIVIGLTVRGRDADRFWFSLFHELYHILAGHIFEANSVNLEEQEVQADSFAKNILIPDEDYRRFSSGYIDRPSILRFSSEIGIAPGIVVGRLQKEKRINYKWYNDLKVRYTLSH